MDNQLKTAGLLCFTLILALVGPIALAQEQFLPAPTPVAGGYATGNYQNYQGYQYVQPAAPYPPTQYQATQYQAAQYPTTQQPAAPYPAGQYQAAQYPTAQQSVAPYSAGQYQVAQYPATAQRLGNQVQSAGTSPAAKANYYTNPAANRNASQAIAANQVQPARYIQPSMPVLQPPSTSRDRMPSLRPTPNSTSLSPYGNAPATSPPAYPSPAYTPYTTSALNPTKPGSVSASTNSIEGQMVVDVRIVGNRSIRKERIAAMIHTRKGREFSSEMVQRDVRELSRKGLFVNVKPSYQETPEGPIVIFEVIERPLLDSIKFVGAKAIKRKILLKESGLAEGDAADPFKVEEARRTLEFFYHDKGFAQARIKIHKGNKPGDREAIFVINEGSKQKILWTKFEGNKVASDARLRTQIESKQGILWFINGEFNRERIEQDKGKLTAYYRGLGYFDAKVGAEVSFTFDNWAMITFVVNEGPRYKVRNTRFIGHKIYETGQLRKDLKLLSGEYFNQNKMSADIRAIQERYGRVGHVFAAVKAEPRFLEEPGVLDLVYKIKEGDQYRVGEIIVQIKGAGETSRTKNTVILDRLSLGPGDIIDTQKIRESERRIRSSAVFSTNPATGAVPKILISPPDNLDEPRGPRG